MSGPFSETRVRRRGCSRSTKCWGAPYCLHRFSAGRSAQYFIAATQYNYGVDDTAQLIYDTVVNVFASNRLSLKGMVQCGASAPLLAFAGVTIGVLVDRTRYTFEYVVDALKLTWPLLVLMGFEIDMLKDSARFPLIVLYDKLGVRGYHFLPFYRTPRQLKSTFLALDMAAIGINLACWTQ